MVVGLRIYWDLIADGAGWRGQGYSPEDGRYYRAHLRAKGNKLTMKGCVAVFCRTVTWTRVRSEEHTSELQSLMRISYAVFCLKKKNRKHIDKKIVNKICKIIIFSCYIQSIH